MRYKKFSKKVNKKKCPPGKKRCGNSWKCYPMNTICEGEEVKKEKVFQKKADNEAKSEEKKAERVIPYKTLIAGAVAVTVVGASVGYLLTKKKEVVPQKAELSAESDAIPSSLQKYDPSKNKDLWTSDVHEKADLARKSDDEMFHYKQSIKQRQEQGKIGTESPKYVHEEIISNKVSIAKENRKLAQEWARKVLNDPDTIILDLETTNLMTGVDPYAPDTWKRQRANVPEIAQIGMVDSNLNSVDIHLRTNKPLGKEAAQIMGVEDRYSTYGYKAKNLPDFDEYYEKLNKLLDGKRVIAFNGRFDLQVIDALCVKYNKPLIQYKNRPNRLYDTNNQSTILKESILDNEADAMHWWGLYLGKGIAPGMSGGRYNPDKGLAYASLPTLPGAKAHDARADCFSTYDVIRQMAMGVTPNKNAIKKNEWEKWMETQ